MSLALVRANFIYADFFRWLGGIYNSRNRNFTDTFAIIDQVRAYNPPDGYPDLDFDRAWRIFTEGAPLVGHFQCSRQSVAARNLRSTVATTEAASAIMDKFIKEENLCYHIFFPRIIWRFIPGLFLALINWVAPKAWRIADTGRLCIDPSSRISPQDDGNTNRWIPDTGFDHDQNPTVAYGTAFRRFLQYIYNLRIDKPKEDILLSADDISSAFRRITYNPSIATVFASIFGDYLIIPVGHIFGSKSSPSFYMLPGEIRAHLARHLSRIAPNSRSILADRLDLIPPPTPLEVLSFRSAVPDALNQGRSSLLRVGTTDIDRLVYAPYVDDTGTAATREFIRDAVHNSILAAYIVYGFPDEDSARPQAMNPAKFVTHVTFSMKFLGFIINTRTLTVEWPHVKQHQLYLLLHKVLHSAELQGDRRRITPHQAASILGLLRHSAVVSTMGVYLGLSLQFLLNDCIRFAASKGKSTNNTYFRKSHRFTLGTEAIADIRTLQALLPPSLLQPAPFSWI